MQDSLSEFGFIILLEISKEAGWAGEGKLNLLDV